jgi:large subunit ribosomal protein L6
MSRVGKNPVVLPQGVEASLEGNVINLKGKMGDATHAVSPLVNVALGDKKIVLTPKNDTAQARALWGTNRSILHGMVTGISNGFTINMEIIGVGYRAALQGNTLVLQLGYSHEVVFPIPAGIKIVVDKQTLLAVTGSDKQVVGQVAAKIRGFRPPEPYKGKGIKYVNEKILRKEGKKK